MTKQPEEAILVFWDTGFSYPDGRVILDNVTVRFRPETFHLVEGPSGAGKSTLLRLAVRFEIPDRGVILFREKNVETLDPSLLRTKLALVQQIPIMLEGSVRHNLLLPFSFPRNRDKPVPTDEELKVRLEECMLDGLSLDKEASSCSVGQKQRLSIIRSLLLDPDVLLLDEPTSGLDPESRDKVQSMLEHLNRHHGMTMIMVNHTGYRPETCRVHVHELKDGKIRRTA